MQPEPELTTEPAKLERLLTAAVAEIHREAQERAQPYLDRLARLKASEPPRLPIIATRAQATDALRLAQPFAAPTAEGWTDRGRAWLQAGAPIGDAFAAFPSVPRSRSQVVREALLDAFSDAPDATRANLRAVLLDAPDATRANLRAVLLDATEAQLERLQRLLK